MSDVSPNVANVPHDIVWDPDDPNRCWCYGELELSADVYGVGSTEAEAVADFFQAALKRYQDLTVDELHGALTLSQARELEYFRRWRGE